MSAGIYPISSCSYKPEIEKSVFREDPFIHISTTGGSDLGCAVCCEMLDIQSDPKFLAHVKNMGKLFGNGLKEIADNHSDVIREIRGRGLMWGMEFGNERQGQIAMVSIIKEGILQNYCGNKEDTLIIMPPLISQKEDIVEILEKVEKGIKNLKNFKL